LITSDDQLTNHPADVLINQKWQRLVNEFQDAWNADEFEKAKGIFNELVDISSSLLLTIAKSKVPAEIAEDVVADTYLEFYEMLVAHKPIHNAKSLLCQIVRFHSIDECRRYKRTEEFVSLANDTMWGILQNLPDLVGNTPEEIIVSRDTAHFASNLILNVLSGEEQQVLIMRYVRELSVAETAIQLHMTVDQVKKKTQRATERARCVAKERGLLNDFS
jgi:RNA polymerase sigma factor (sigma-70 family)